VDYSPRLGTTKANPLLTCGEDWLFMFHPLTFYHDIITASYDGGYGDDRDVVLKTGECLMT
jgi:hypothetical protein